MLVEIPSQVKPCVNVKTIPFSAGEELTYKLYYNLNFIWIAAGEVKFKVEDQGDRYKLSATGRTYSSYNWFLKPMITLIHCG